MAQAQETADGLGIDCFEGIGTTEVLSNPTKLTAERAGVGAATPVPLRGWSPGTAGPDAGTCRGRPAPPRSRPFPAWQRDGT